MAQLLITGAAGFIGSHTCLVLLKAGHRLVLIDNYSNSSPEALKRVAKLAGREAEGRIKIIEGDVCCSEHLDRAFSSCKHRIDAVMHFAGLKAVSESVQFPLRYWDINVGGSNCLLQAMQRHDCRTIIFSSSATLYGYPTQVPIPESAILQPINPYGHSKAAVEQLLMDIAASEPGWRIARLRYFNPVGAHPSGHIGEDPNGIPNNLFPFISQVAVGRHPQLEVFGNDWPTPDGSGVRDYIHVMDLAEGHQAALDVLLKEEPQLLTLNLGGGQGHSVLEVVQAFEATSGRTVPYKISGRRIGDAACTVADPSLAATRLGWHTQRDLMEICRDSWRWQQNNPNGYDKKCSS